MKMGLILITIGGVLGLLLGLIVSSALYYIRESSIFSVIFGFVLSLLGIVLIWRTTSSTNNVARLIVILYGTLVIVSGLFCFWLDVKGAEGHLRSNFEKYLLYCSLAISLSFALTYSLVDVIAQFQAPRNILEQVQQEARELLFKERKQLYVIVAATTFCGILFGILFVEMIQQPLLEQILVGIIGAGVGIGVIILNRKIEQQAGGGGRAFGNSRRVVSSHENSFQPLPMEDELET